MTAVNERYKLNKELAQMLKGGVIMDRYGTGADSGRHPCRRRRFPYE